METHDDYYSLKGTVQNLMLLKLAYDSGVNIKDFPNYIINDFGMEYGWDIFLRAIDCLFTIVECWHPYSGKEDISDKSYWCKVASIQFNDENEVESIGLLVLLDDNLDPEEIRKGTLTLGGGSDFYSGFAELIPFEKGAILTWDEDYGSVDLVDVLYGLIKLLPNKKEHKKDAVAI